MNLEQWSKLKPGDVLHYCDDAEGPFLRLLAPFRREPRSKHQTWPDAWTWEPVDPMWTQLTVARPTIDKELREFWLVKVVG